MKFKKTVLKNGMRIITVPMKDNNTVTVMALVETGSKYEPKELGGLSHFLEHMCFKGTTKRPTSFAISLELDGMGAESNAFTNTEYTGYYAKAGKKYFTKIFDVVSDIYLNSTFPEGEMEKEKGVVIEEINMYEDLPQRKVWDIFETLLYGDQPAGRPIIGTKESLLAMKREDLVKYHSERYVAKATVVVVAGNISEKVAVKAVEKAFAEIKTTAKKGKPATIENQKKPAVSAVFRKTDQTHLILGFRAFDLHDKRNWQLSVLATILGRGASSRLFMKMREELGICYYIRASQSASTDHGYFSISAGVGTKRTGEAVEAIMRELVKIKKEGVGEAELRKAKDLMIGGMALSLESSDEYADFFGFQEVFHEPILSQKEQVQKIEAITTKDIKKMAELIFVEKGLNLALIGPEKDGPGFLPLLHI